VSNPGSLAVAPYDLVTAVVAQAKGVLLTIVWSGIGSAILFKVTDLLVGLRVSTEAEREGLDITEHDESAYNY